MNLPALRYSLHAETLGHGPLALVLHGFVGSGSSMSGLVGRLTRDVRMIVPDLIGHGSSPAPATPAAYTADAQIDQLDRIITAHTRDDPVHLVGYSMGARLALTYAVARTHRVASLVLIGGTPGIGDPAARAARRDDDESLADRIERDGVAAFVDWWEQRPVFASQRHLPRSLRARIRAGRLDQRAVGLANSLRGFGAGAMPPLWDRLGEVTAPTLAVAGALDVKFVDIARQLERSLGRGRCLVIEGVGHAAHLEAPDAVADAVRDHIVR